jgi:hypothetical protein
VGITLATHRLAKSTSRGKGATSRRGRQGSPVPVDALINNTYSPVEWGRGLAERGGRLTVRLRHAHAMAEWWLTPPESSPSGH